MERTCPCGCGRPVKKRYSKDGEFTGYYRGYAEGCSHRYGKGIRINPSGMAHPCALPIGSRRKSDRGSKAYWRIKVSERGPWPYEHRVLMEARLGRPLERNECVHHINGDTLDNRPENLAVILRGDHARHHHGIIRWARDFDACVECGRSDSKHVSRGLCNRCYVQKRYWTRYRSLRHPHLSE